jgi:hypothetical protein
VVDLSAGFCYMVSGRKVLRMVFGTHLPLPRGQMSNRGHVEGIEEDLLLVIAQVMLAVGSDRGFLRLRHDLNFSTRVRPDVQVVLGDALLVIFLMALQSCTLSKVCIRPFSMTVSPNKGYVELGRSTGRLRFNEASPFSDTRHQCLQSSNRVSYAGEMHSGEVPRVVPGSEFQPRAFISMAQLDSGCCDIRKHDQ